MTAESIFYWQDLFDSPAVRQVEIHPANPYLSDGVLRCGKAETCAALELKRSHSRSSGSQSVELILLLKGLVPEVMPGDKIVYNGEFFELAKVELCRSVTGEITARRCTVK